MTRTRNSQAVCLLLLDNDIIFEGIKLWRYISQTVTSIQLKLVGEIHHVSLKMTNDPFNKSANVVNVCIWYNRDIVQIKMNLKKQVCETEVNHFTYTRQQRCFVGSSFIHIHSVETSPLYLGVHNLQFGVQLSATHRLLACVHAQDAVRLDIVDQLCSCNKKDFHTTSCLVVSTWQRLYKI